MNKLKAARTNKGITQKQLSELAAVPIKTLQKYESGERDILKAEVGAVIRIAKILEVNIEDLVEQP